MCSSRYHKHLLKVLDNRLATGQPESKYSHGYWTLVRRGEEMETINRLKTYIHQKILDSYQSKDYIQMSELNMAMILVEEFEAQDGGKNGKSVSEED